MIATRIPLVLHEDKPKYNSHSKERKLSVLNKNRQVDVLLVLGGFINNFKFNVNDISYCRLIFMIQPLNSRGSVPRKLVDNRLQWEIDTNNGTITSTDIN